MNSHIECEMNIDIRIIFAIYSPFKEDVAMASFVATPSSFYQPQARLVSAQSGEPFIQEPSLHSKNYLVQSKPKLLDQVRQAIRTRHYSLRTEKVYTHWVKRFILFHNKRHPREMGE